MTRKKEAETKRRAPAINIEIGISEMDERWSSCGLDLQEGLTEIVLNTLAESNLFPESENRLIEISVVLADNIYVQTLNREYRQKDKPTNVLSFPQMEFENGLPDGDEPLVIGDIILAYETIEKEAQEQEKSFSDHFSHLIVHGTLHLLGFDHENDEEAEEMESLEILILKQIGIENPYSSTNFMA